MSKQNSQQKSELSLRELEERRLEAILKTTISKGWLVFIEEVKQELENWQRTFDLQCQTNDEFQRLKGYMAALRYVLAYQQNAAEALDNLPDAEFEDEKSDDEEEGNPLEE